MVVAGQKLVARPARSATQRMTRALPLMLVWALVVLWVLVGVSGREKGRESGVRRYLVILRTTVIKSPGEMSVSWGK